MKKTITKIFVILLLVVFNICNIYAANLNATLNIAELITIPQIIRTKRIKQLNSIQMES